MKKSAHTPGSVRRLEDIPNVGCAVADELRALGITAPIGLVGRDPWALYAELNARRGFCHDPCLLDTFLAADLIPVATADGEDLALGRVVRTRLLGGLVDDVFTHLYSRRVSGGGTVAPLYSTGMPPSG